MKLTSLFTKTRLIFFVLLLILSTGISNRSLLLVEYCNSPISPFELKYCGTENEYFGLPNKRIRVDAGDALLKPFSIVLSVIDKTFEIYDDSQFRIYIGKYNQQLSLFDFDYMSFEKEKSQLLTITHISVGILNILFLFLLAFAFERLWKNKSGKILVLLFFVGYGIFNWSALIFVLPESLLDVLFSNS